MGPTALFGGICVYCGLCSPAKGHICPLNSSRIAHGLKAQGFRVEAAVIPAGYSPRVWNTLAQMDWSGTGDVRTCRVVRRRSLQAVLSCIGPYLPSNCCSNAKQGFGAQAAPIPAGDYSGALKKLPQMESGLYGGCPCPSCGSDGALWVFALNVCCIVLMAISAL